MLGALLFPVGGVCVSHPSRREIGLCKTDQRMCSTIQQTITENTTSQHQRRNNGSNGLSLVGYLSDAEPNLTDSIC